MIMNPPFISATNHEGAHADITNPAFAAFDATHADQTAMGQRANKLAENTCYHGNAGIASAFAALAHKKVKPGGVLALVLPLSATVGLSWQGFRKMLEDHYTGLTVLTIAATDNEDLSFSSDTGMAECLVVARRIKPVAAPVARPLTLSPSGLPAVRAGRTDYAPPLDAVPGGDLLLAVEAVRPVLVVLVEVLGSQFQAVGASGH